MASPQVNNTGRERFVGMTTYAKDFFFSNGDPLTSIGQLMDLIHKQHFKFPLIAEDGNGLRANGELGRTGVTITSEKTGALIAAVKNPDLTPLRMGTDGIVEFGGPPTVDFIEHAMEVPISIKEVSTSAQLLLTGLQQYGSLATLSRRNSGFAAIGSEPEAWAIDPSTGNLIEVSAGELQLGCVEETLPAISSSDTFIKARATQILERKRKYGEAIIVDTSTLISSSPREVKVNTGNDKGPYIQAIQQSLKKNYWTFSDPDAEQVMDQIAQAYGFINHADMQNMMENTMVYWAMAASHASVGLPHMRFSNEAHATSEIEAIAVGDIFNTNLATIAEMLMFSSPMIFGVTPTVRGPNGEMWQPRDTRAIARYAMDTAEPSPPALTPQRMRENIIYAIEHGLTNTMDRGTYLATMPDGRIVPSAHGRVRNRIATPEPKNQTGRIEVTGCPASFSILDETARNCFLQVLTIAAYEALAHGQHPMEYFAENYPNLGDWSRQKELGKKASLQGFHEPEVKSLIQEAVGFLKDMRTKYPALTVETAIAQSRMENLLLPPTESLEEYIKNPRGPVSEVLQKEIKNGVDPVTLVKKIEAYELILSQRIIDGHFILPTKEQVLSYEQSRSMASLFLQS